jgi:phosphomannomutase
MLEEQAPLAGELSGHIFYADGFYGFDDALYAAVRLLRILSRSPESLAEMSAALSRTVASPEYRFDCPEERKFAAVAEVAARLKAEGARVVAIDGVRVESDDGWWLLRASNTQAALSARCEAADAPALKRLKAALARQLRLSGLTPPAEL